MFGRLTPTFPLLAVDISRGDDPPDPPNAGFARRGWRFK
jgi:hypothetical protein